MCVGGYSDTSRVTPPATGLGCECASSPWVFTPMIDLWLSWVISSLMNRLSYMMGGNRNIQLKEKDGGGSASTSEPILNACLDRFQGFGLLI